MRRNQPTATQGYSSQEFQMDPRNAYGRQAQETYPSAEISRSYYQEQRPGVPYAGNQSGYSHSMMSDMTSAADYTLSGNNGQQMMMYNQQIPSAELTQEHISILLEQGFSRGLAKALVENAQSFDHRIWVVDNSGSMQIGDGHRVNNADGKITMVPVSRWEEIQDTVIYHSQMAAVLNSYTRFRLLNDPGVNVGRQEFSVGQTGKDVEQEIRQARLVMTRAKPDGVTPLTDHIWEIQQEIRQMLPHLQRTGQRVAVILATDGLPTDSQGYGGDEITNAFLNSLRALEGLPIWLVIRLCTDETEVTDFYNKLDGMLELSLEVLDDFLGESQEVQRCNPWLNYALPIHRCRELGYHDRLFDLIDERALTKKELRDFCALLFGTDYSDIPDPLVDWKAFLSYVQDRLIYEQPQWNPLKKKIKPWISLKRLNKIYGGSACTIM